MTESMTTEPQPIAPPKLAIFDCDGVLVDSLALSVRVFGRLLADCGLQLQPNEIRTISADRIRGDTDVVAGELHGYD